MKPIEHIRNSVLLLMLALYLCLNYGFMLVRIPPSHGGGVPVGEVVLLLSLVSINYTRLLYRLSSVIYILPFIVWWIFGISSAIYATGSHGMWALRDATNILESLFILVGFAFAGNFAGIEQLFRWLPKILFAVSVYSLGYLFQGSLQSYSPVIMAGSGQIVSIFFQYINTSMMLLMAASFLMLYYTRSNFVQLLAIPFIVIYTVLLFQSRTVYLQVIALVLLFVIYKRELIGKGAVYFLVGLGGIALLPLSGIQIEGRLGQVASFDFIWRHFAAIWGVASHGLEGSAAGVAQRLDWWLIIYHRLISSPSTFLFGLGFGMPLVDFLYYGGITVREPHNSVISVFARVGLLGGFCFLWMHLQMIRVWRVSYKTCCRLGWGEWQNRLLILMVYFVLIWVFSIGEDALEKPFNAIPYYFFWGVVLRINWHINRHLEQAYQSSSPVRPSGG